MNLIGQHHDAQCFYELFHPNIAERSRFKDRRYLDNEDGATFIQDVYSWKHSRSIHALGFKLFYKDAQHEPASSVWEYLAANPEIKIIDLIRENYLATYVSLQIALQTNQWLRRHIKPFDQYTPHPPFKVDPDVFVQWVDGQKKLHQQALDTLSGNPLLTVSYEDLASHRTRCMTRVFQFLGLRCYPRVGFLRQYLRKQQTSPLSKQISNYDELRRACQKTDLVTLFRESKNK